MSDKKFKKILAAVVVLGFITTIILVSYTVHLHNNCSIITYISNER